MKHLERFKFFWFEGSRAISTCRLWVDLLWYKISGSAVESCASKHIGARILDFWHVGADCGIFSDSEIICVYIM